MSRLALYLLGPPRVERARPDGGEAEAVRISRTKVVALLAYLAVTAQPHRRDALVALLSPELDTTRAARELRRSLYELNRVLGPGYLAANREIVHLHITTGPSSTPLAHREISPTGSERALWIDVAQFRQLLAVCETHGHPTYEACADCVPSLNDAVQLYSDHFLAGFTLPDSLAFEEWQFFQAEELCQALGSALQRLVRWYSAQGEQTYERAIGYARRWLALDPLHEPAHRQLMALYAQSGHPAAALRQYRVCLRTLEEELGVPPAAETTALYERIRAERAVAAPSPVPRPAVPAAVPAFLGEEAPRAIVPKPVFVARERELARLGTHLEAALTGRGQVAFVTGGPGRGKTALMEAFARKAMEAHPDLLVAMGRCNAYSGVGDPYLPFRDVLGMLTGDVEGRWAAGTISAEHARRLWNTLPEAVRALLDYGPHLIETFVPAAALLPRAEAASHAIGAKTLQELRVWLDRRRSSASGLDQARIFQQVADTLAALSSSKPLLLILDDLQWTDTASASLLFHLGRRLADAGGRILILGAYRPEEVALDRPSARFAQHPERDERTGERERHPMQKVLSEFRRHYGEMWLDLTTADQVEGRAFVDAYLDSPASPWASNRLEDEFRAALTERTDGHALFTIELLRGMHERGGLTQDVEGVWITGPALDWERLPARVEAVIQERIERLDAGQRHLLTVASVEGEVFTAQAVAQVQGLSERQVLHHLSHELGPRVHRLVREAGEVALDHRFAARYQFGHALFQAYLYSTLTGGERRLLHGEVAAALEELYGQHTDAIAPALAHHYQAAGSLAQAAAYATRAGELAYAAYAYVEAGKHHRTALELYREVGDRAKEAAALEELSSAYNCMGAIAEIEKCRQNALAIYRELGDRDGEARILRRLGWIRVFTSKYDQAEPYFLQAVQIWREIGEPHAATKALHGLGRFHREHTGNFVRAKAYAQETLRLSLESGDRYGEAMGKFSIGFALYYQGDYSAADPYMRGAVQLLGEPGWLDDCACCLIGVGLNAIALGNYAMARAHLQESRSMFREARTDDLDDDGWAQSALALLYHQQDEDQTACDQARRALRIHRTFGHRYRQAFALVHLGHSLVGLGRLEEATDAYKQALDLRREMGHRHLVSEPLAGMARVALALDDPAAALVYVEEILSHLETRSVDGTDEPLRIYLTCYRVLRANGDPRADEVLETAHCLLQERAAKIEDEEVRRSFLENVAAHRELASEWHAVGRDGSTRP